MEKKDLPEQLLDYIGLIRGKPYRLFTDNCIHKNLKVARMARALGLTSKLILCLTENPRLWGFFDLYSPHTYLEVEGEKIDVFYAVMWGTERTTKGRIVLWTIKGKEPSGREKEGPVQIYVVVIVYEGRVCSVTSFTEEGKAAEEFKLATGCPWAQFQDLMKNYDDEFILKGYAGSRIWETNAPLRRSQL